MQKLIDALQGEIATTSIIAGEDAIAHQQSWSLGASQAPLVLRPCSTEDVAAIMRCCHRFEQTVVLQGGKTGLVQGCFAGPNDVVISMELMSHIEEVDVINRTMTVQAGTVLQNVQEAAQEQELIYPLDLGARGTATIGGNISTNAGGNQVIRYGMTRDMVLGLEVVLANGTVISSMNRMLKNNAAYDLKQLFIGSEGTLGIVTRAVLRLRSAPMSQNTALLAVSEFDALVCLLGSAEARLGGSLSAFEVMWNSYYRYASQGEHLRFAMASDYPYYLLIETQGADQEHDAQSFQSFLEFALEQQWIEDAVLSASQSERDNLWAIRDNLASLAPLSPFLLFDISMSISSIQAYLTKLESQLYAVWPGKVECAVFGHMGDGNLHLVITVGSETNEEKDAVTQIVYGGLVMVGGSISAEHGIGLDKKPYLHYSRSSEEIALMRTLKHALDPQGLLNPGIVLET